MSPVTRKPVLVVSDQLRHKPACTVTEQNSQLEFLDFGKRGIVLSLCYESNHKTHMQNYFSHDVGLMVVC